MMYLFLAILGFLTWPPLAVILPLAMALVERVSSAPVESLSDDAGQLQASAALGCSTALLLVGAVLVLVLFLAGAAAVSVGNPDCATIFINQQMGRCP